MNTARKTELLAPAGSMESLTAALRCGADAVYAGARQFSARANAENFDAAGLSAAARLCHLYGAKLFLAVNTLLFDAEFPALDMLLQTAAAAGADGCIVQDPGVAAYMAKRLPSLRLHASTQLTIHSPAGVRFAKQAGFCRVVAARELSAKQLAAFCEEADRCGMEVEAFVHGAHCMSVSGQCWMSAAMGGRSANRGCCAQPCRLPFSADPAQKNACALSLKDMSLVQHLPEITALGVLSLKIEGRMKRPEYVAAAVSACRSALDGRQPDLQTLRAVFSRSGFTDGYFTGERREMFGTRQKEDVTAAQEVLAGLRAAYQKPRKVAALNAHFSLHMGQPAALTVTDGTRTVTVTGEMPQAARSHATDLPMLQKQFDKLGDTVYTAGSVTADCDDRIMLPAAALNALRRTAAAAMDEARIQANTPQHTLAEKPPLPFLPHMPAKQPKFRLQIRRPEQLAEIGELAEALDAMLLPLQFAKDYLTGSTPVPPERVILLPPRFYTDEAQIIEKLTAAKAAGFLHLGCRHAADAQLGRELGFTLHGAEGLHITNAFTAEFWAEFGLADGLCSPEAARIPAQMLPLGVYAYGKLPLMLVRNCPIRAQAGCAKCRHILCDRKGAALYTDCTRITEKPDYAEIFNTVPVWLADRPKAFRHAAYALLSMTDETAAEVRRVLEAYLSGETGCAPAQYTRGLHLSDAGENRR